MLQGADLDTDFGISLANANQILFTIGVKDSRDGSSNNPFLYDDEITVPGKGSLY
jgi:hypothetical protein